MGLKIKTGKRFLRGFSSPALDPMKGRKRFAEKQRGSPSAMLSQRECKQKA
jgi:hypothetical protein